MQTILSISVSSRIKMHLYERERVIDNSRSTLWWTYRAQGIKRIFHRNFLPHLCHIYNHGHNEQTRLKLKWCFYGAKNRKCVPYQFKQWQWQCEKVKCLGPILIQLHMFYLLGVARYCYESCIKGIFTAYKLRDRCIVSGNW